MKEYAANSSYSNRAGGAMFSGWYRSRSKAEDAAVAMTAKGYEDVTIREREVEEEAEENE